LESGGVINNRNFGEVNRTDDFQGFGVSGAADIGFGDLRQLIFGYSYGHTSSAANSAAVSTGGDDLNILSPQGPGGGLGGGLNIGGGGGGFADVTNLRYTDSYAEHLVFFGVSFAPWRLPNTGARVRPYVNALLGYVRETSDYSGTTAGGGEDFGYSNKLETTRYGAAFGAKLEQPIYGAFGLYFDGELRVIENHTSVRSTLTVSGGINATETANASADKLDAGGIFGAGIYYITGNVTVRAGASYETWQVPTLKFSETGPVSIDYGTRESIAATLTATVRFPPQCRSGAGLVLQCADAPRFRDFDGLVCADSAARRLLEMRPVVDGRSACLPFRGAGALIHRRQQPVEKKPRNILTA
jgi:hypothetical protein